MDTPNTSLTIQSVRPQDLSQRDFERLADVSQDMWASEAGLGELAKCDHCGRMHSKEDVFGELPEEYFQKTVAEIMGDQKVLACHSCGKETRMVYGSDNVENIRKRLLSSMDSFLVVCQDAKGEIVGFKDGYVDTIDKIFEQEFAYHYRLIGVHAVKARIKKILGFLPSKMFAVSSVGLLAPHRNFYNLFETMNQFARNLPDEYLDMPGIAELDKRNVLYRMCEMLETVTSMEIGQDPALAPKICDVGKDYNSELVILGHRSRTKDSGVVRAYKDGFTHGPKHFLRLSRPPRLTHVD